MKRQKKLETLQKYLEKKISDCNIHYAVDLKRELVYSSNIIELKQIKTVSI